MSRSVGRKVFDQSGLLVNVGVMAVWVLLIWFGLFLVYSSNPEAISNSSGREATALERLYFAGYTLSTLGLGNFTPTTPFFEILTSIFSFFGFVLFTSSVTYFLSVFSAVVNKRTFARSIANLGTTPQEIAAKLLAMDHSYTFQQLLTLQELAEQHAVNHQAYPVTHFFSHSNPDFCFSLMLARLDEALGIVLSNSQSTNMYEEVQQLRSTLTHLMNHIDRYYSRSLPEIDSLPEIPAGYNITSLSAQELQSRRICLTKLLKSESFDWEDVLVMNNSKR